MAQPQSRVRSRSGNRPKAKHVPDSRTKFDVWLDSHLESGSYVKFLFKHDPISGAPLVRLECSLLTVDRYHVYLEILGEEGEPVWVAKDNIIGAA